MKDPIISGHACDEYEVLLPPEGSNNPTFTHEDRVVFRAGPRVASIAAKRLIAQGHIAYVRGAK